MDPLTTFTPIDWSKCPAVERQDGKVSGAWIFKGTRIPVHALIENLRDGATVNEFLSWFQGVLREQVDQVVAYKEFQIVEG